MYEYQAELIRVVDGDTLMMRVDLGCDIRLDMTIRLAGLNSPEKGTQEGADATAYTTNWLANHGTRFVVKTIKDRKEKFGRYAAYVYNESSINCLNDDLIADGHAVPYNGGKR